MESSRVQLDYVWEGKVLGHRHDAQHCVVTICSSRSGQSHDKCCGGGGGVKKATAYQDASDHIGNKVEEVEAPPEDAICIRVSLGKFCGLRKPIL